ncbi:hypothetical protein AMES_5746 [Amycolatopsis mediterranei S699]|uniref:Uncharacterized protein n=2 Tax=Amycolatopsis mediterranei TaxID=33910 RepID=A0A0H3DA98_AMYMU|nr:hypothetical protein AMED_5825 [Amycolatopsis mediterranei U32]AEK44451.1 hypothetical protein RAM_29880 [Amycolatopsis mediterranei S699]AGT86410.1 hypothetical protein B737_5746 [Amycolatopsis mediterranei RB]KDO11260.1 hypothetical protein DV26_08515 [Amycolatopsis mediterranei]AFO79282.1 hypothetical protein AMES_5746 [Amycolatopsis mediterranei S699]
MLGSRFALRVMDWRDSNIVLGEQMNTRGFDSSRLLPSHKGVGILRPDGDTSVGADVLAMTVRTYYMPNEDWRTICEQGRTLREAAGTLTGHAAGQDTMPVLDHAAAVKAIGAGHAVDAVQSPGELPEVLASLVEYLGDDLSPDGRDFVPTAELLSALEIDRKTFAQQMTDAGCRPTRDRVTSEDGETRQVRGYLTAEIRIAIDRAAAGTGAADEDDQR